MWTGHRKEIGSWLFELLPFVGAIASVKAIRLSLRQRANTRNVSLRIIFTVANIIHIINPVDKTKLCSNTPTDAAPQSP